MPQGVEPVNTSTVFEPSDAKLAAYLCLLGYDEPPCVRKGSNIVFVFTKVQQQDVLSFYNREPAYLSPLDLFKKYERLIGKAKLVQVNMSITPFETSP